MFSVSKRPTIGEILDLYRTQKAEPEQIIHFFLNRSKQLDKKILAVNSYTEELAITRASELSEILANYRSSYDEKEWFEKLIEKYPLFGVPYMMKANVLVEGYVFNAGSAILNNFKAPYCATVYNKLTDSGALLLGVCNMDEFAAGASGEHCYYGTTKNPFDTERVPGGSSSGPAAAVGSGQIVFSIGTDTGGSVRQPGAFCDVVALKPTYGLVSRYGVMAMASSFDQVGSITNTVSDNALVTKVLAGQDKLDQTTVDSSELQEKLATFTNNKKDSRKVKNPTKTSKPLRIGLPIEFYVDGIDPKIREAITNLQKKLQQLGHTLVDVSIPLTKYAVSVYYVTMPVEFASNLERIDGVRYAPQQENYKDLYFEHRGKYLGDEPLRRIMLGTYASSAGYFDAYYNKAQKVKELARRSFEKVFEDVDVLLTPTTPEFPFKVGDKTSDPLKMYLSDVFTCGINPVRIPGLAVPLGMINVNNEEVDLSLVSDDQDLLDENTPKAEKPSPAKYLPTGCQLLGKELSEDVLFQLGQEIENLIK